MAASAQSRKPFDWTLVAFVAVTVYIVFLAAMFEGHLWLRGPHNAIVANDFIDVFAAGKMAAGGHAASVYDWAAHRSAEVGVAGHNFDGYYGWHYPPHFLFVAVVLAQLPYFVSFFTWVLLTLPLYAFVTARVAGRRDAMLWALAFPAALLDIYVGQNGFVTAALIGGMLLLLEERPLLAGVLLGLLTYKPQFGLLFPLVFFATGQWRVLLSASATALLVGLASLAVFGSDAWIAFAHSIPHTSDMILAGGHAGWNKLQTIYGLSRVAGAGDRVAWIAQLSVIAAEVVGLVVLWRSEASFALKAAALCVATLLATPYAYIYDFPLLAVSIAFLYRAQRFDRVELSAVAAAAILVASFPWTGAPVGLAADVLVVTIICRRAWKVLPMTDKVALQHA